MKKKTITILYTHFPHYREPIIRELFLSDKYEFLFFYDPMGVDSTIQSGAVGRLGYHIRTYKIGPFLIQPGALSQVLKNSFDGCILLGNPYILTNWIIAIIARCRGSKVLLWTHGWLREESGFKDIIRNIYYRLADVLLLYGDRARQIGINKGFDLDRMHVIYNSLDYESQVAARLNNDEALCEKGNYFLCVSRLIPEVQIDLAINALAQVNSLLNISIPLIIVGEGPERDSLSALAGKEQVDVVFKGGVYDENELARLFMCSIAVVSPGKIGLLAMHALVYGAPVITHGDFDYQMPEVEAITPGVSGDFFLRGDVSSLASVMLKWQRQGRSEKSKLAAMRTIEAHYTPKVQKELVESVLNKLFFN